MKKLLIAIFALCITLSFSGCSAEPGTESWCNSMKEKTKGDWTATETGTFTKYCLLGKYKK